ncbi:YkgJ family cysteine cluster protein [Massilia violaceinigra]|uniref:YkgJ family cysteine cluster protein n=1 Tax=Massilia violaceinigra TaxID=2045208 RepID=UPI00351D654C
MLAPETAWLDRGDGICRNLDLATARCRIYDRRPDVCNVRAMYEQRYRKQMAWPVFVVLNQVACDELRKLRPEVLVR